MPYIPGPTRTKFDAAINRLVSELNNYENDALCGQLNYVISSLIWRMCGHNGDGELNYARINAVLGAVEAAKLEFYRRIAVPYEDEKIEQNGDI